MTQSTSTEDIPEGEPFLNDNRAQDRSPGEMVRDARLKLNYSVEQLCNETKLFKGTLEALEDDDYDQLSQPVFAPGYYRQCARVLDLDESELIAAYQRRAGSVGVRSARDNIGSIGITPTNVTPKGRSRFPRLLLIIVLLLALVIAAVVVLLPNVSLPGSQDSGTQSSDTDTTTRIQAPVSQDDANSDSSSQANSDADSEPSASTPDVARGGGATESDVSDAASDNGDDAKPTGGRKVSKLFGNSDSAVARARSQRSSAADDQSSTAANNDAAASSVPANQLKMTFDKKSWVSVKNANGNRLFSGIFKSGDSRTFNGQPPYKIILGYPPGVHVTIGGKNVNIPDHGSVAHLTVSARQNG